MNEAGVARVGILGGTLDPIHVGHLDRRGGAATALDLTRMLVMPSRIPPHRTLAAGRLAVPPVRDGGAGGQRAIPWLRSPMRSCSAPGRPSPRIRSNGCTRRDCAPSQIFFITGADAFADIETWHRYPEVLDLAHFVVVSRPGFAGRALPSRLPGTRGSDARAAAGRRRPVDRPSVFPLDAATPDVSSTDIRRRLRRGEPVAGLVPPPVETHIRQHGLYQTSRINRQTVAWPKTERKRRDNREARHEAVDGRRRESRAARRSTRRRRGRGARPPEHPAFTDFFVLCSGQNQRQVQAIADAVEETLRAARSAGPRRRLRPRRMDPDGLLHLHRPRLHAADAGVLLPRAAVGRRRADRGERHVRPRRSGLVTRAHSLLRSSPGANAEIPSACSIRRLSGSHGFHGLSVKSSPGSRPAISALRNPPSNQRVDVRRPGACVRCVRTAARGSTVLCHVRSLLDSRSGCGKRPPFCGVCG